ncbi:MAG: type II secretion system protein [Candidatus Taylorbacteria bacterium]|nr:type II secretion system protein [Candidatus Taylorbacteria bacterium]
MKRNKGFTLVELLVVIAIIGILSSVVFASLNSARSKARTASVQSTLRSVMPELQTCADDAGFGWTDTNTPNSTAPTGGTTFACHNTSAGANAAKAGHTITWPTLPTAGSPAWAYSRTTGTLAGNDYVYIATGENHTVTCRFSTGACDAN